MLASRFCRELSFVGCEWSWWAQFAPAHLLNHVTVEGIVLEDGEDRKLFSFLHIQLRIVVLSHGDTIMVDLGIVVSVSCKLAKSASERVYVEVRNWRFPFGFTSRPFSVILAHPEGIPTLTNDTNIDAWMFVNGSVEFFIGKVIILQTSGWIHFSHHNCNEIWQSTMFSRTR